MIMLPKHSHILKRFLSTNINGSFITTPIFYVNADPHIGHVYSAMLADAAHRFQHLKKVSPLIFSTGTDEHGLKVKSAADTFKMDPKEYCDGKSLKFKKIFDKLNISYTNYIRTSDENHTVCVHTIFNKLMESGYIYKGRYSGWYCVSDEQFLPEHDVQKVENNVYSKESGHPVEWVTEDNFMFKLSIFKKDLINWINGDVIKPKIFQNMLRQYLEDEIKDLSISRPKSRVPWGIPLPNNPDHTIYVWFDALINYLTVSGYPTNKIWPPTTQIIGKDILKFHGIYWPALLMALNLEPPKCLLVHSHWTVENMKMSKSIGNVICPNEMSDLLSSEGLRYSLFRNGTPHADTSWSTKLAVEFLNADLANNLGNLLSRCRPVSFNPNQEFPGLPDNYVSLTSERAEHINKLIKNLPKEVGKHYSDFNFYKGIDEIIKLLHYTNEFVTEEKPWKLGPNDKLKLDSIIHISLSSVRAAGIALQPIIPQTANRLLDSLNVSLNNRFWDNISDFPNTHTKTFPLGQKEILFQRIKY